MGLIFTESFCISPRNIVKSFRLKVIDLTGMDFLVTSTVHSFLISLSSLITKIEVCPIPFAKTIPFLTSAILLSLLNHFKFLLVASDGNILYPISFDSPSSNIKFSYSNSISDIGM